MYAIADVSLHGATISTTMQPIQHIPKSLRAEPQENFQVFWSLELVLVFSKIII
jgi:hypothetical protein